MSARDDVRLALDIIGASAALGAAVAEGVRRVIAAARPDLVLAEPPPAGRYSEIVAEDAAIITRRFPAPGELPTSAPRAPGEALGTPAAASIFRAPPDGFGPKGDA